MPSTCSKTTSSPSRQRSVRFRPSTQASTRARLPRTGSGLEGEWLISNVSALWPGGALNGEAFVCPLALPGDDVKPENFVAFRDDPSGLREKGPLYAFTTFAMFGLGFAAISVGVARATLDAATNESCSMSES